MWGRSVAVGAIVAAVLVVPATSTSAVRHLPQFNSPDRTIWCADRSKAEFNGGPAATGCFATLSPFALTFPEPTTVAETHLSSEYAGWFSTSGKVGTCTAAPPFDASHHCVLSFVTSAPVLAFGETAEIEGVRCASAPDGVTCTKVAGAGAGKGFRINAHEVVRVGSASSGSSPAPTFNRTAVVRTVSGTVLVKTPGSMSFTPLGAVTSVPMGTTIDTTNGTVALTTASDSAGHTQSGQFYSGIFRLTQTRAVSRVRSGRRVGLTVLTLAGGVPSGCGAATATRAHRATSPSARRLWGNAHGNFRTSGRYASATVRGTQWLTEDTCQGTLVKVARGVVAVEELRTHRTTLVRAGHSVLTGAKPPGATLGAAFAGTWEQHESTLVITKTGHGRITYADLARCPSCSFGSAPRGTLKFVLTSVTTGRGTGHVTATSDPKVYTKGESVRIRLAAASPGEFLVLSIGRKLVTNFCNRTSAGQCGA
jgi:hypothetical protein